MSRPSKNVTLYYEDGRCNLCFADSFHRPPTTEGHGERKVNVVEENVEGVFRAVRVEVNKVVDLAASNKESINDGYNKVKAETKCNYEEPRVL